MPCKTLSVFEVQFLKKTLVSVYRKCVSEYEMFKILQAVGFTEAQFVSWNRLSLQHCEDATLNQSQLGGSDFHFVKIARVYFHSTL